MTTQSLHIFQGNFTTTPIPSVSGHFDKFNKSYITTLGCLFDHLIHTDNLTDFEKLYYLSGSGVVSFNSQFSNNLKPIALSAEQWGQRIGCSKTLIFALQKSLEKKGYFKIIKERDETGQHAKNQISTILPSDVLNHLLNSPNKYSLSKEEVSPFNSDSFCGKDESLANKLEYLKNTKLFIRIDYKLFRSILSSTDLTPFSKLLFLDLYLKAYKANPKVKLNDKNINLNAIVNYGQLAKSFNCNKSAISRAIANLKENGLIECNKVIDNEKSLNVYLAQDYAELDLDLNSHTLENKLKHLWDISLNLNYPEVQSTNRGSYDYSDKNKEYKRIYKKKVISTESIVAATNYSVATNDDRVAESDQYNNKIYNDIDIIDKANLTFSTQTTESILSNSFDSSKNNEEDQVNKNLNQALDTDAVSSEKIIDIKKQSFPKPIINLKDIDLFTEEEAIELRAKSGREFNLNFMNQLLLKLKQIRSNCVFEHKNKFISYFACLLKHEKREESKVNNCFYQLKSNLESEDAEARKYKDNVFELRRIEAYLRAVEDGKGNSQYDQVKRKIAAELESKLAYDLLTNLRACIQNSNESIIFKLSKEINNLTEFEQTKIIGILKSVYGNQISDLNLEISVSNIQGAITTENEKIEAAADNIDENCVWGKIRRGLTQVYNIHIDKHWFSKLEASEDNESKQISLKAPSKFYRDWINQNYFSNIQDICRKLGWTIEDGITA